MFQRGITPQEFVQRATSLTEHGTMGWSKRQKSEYVSEVAAFARGQPQASLLTEGEYESLADDEIEYMMDNMTIVLSEIASNPAYLAMNSEDDGYEMRGEMNDTLVRMFGNSRSVKSSGGSSKKNKSASDWVAPQSHGLRNSQAPSSTDADVKESIDYFRNASRGNKFGDDKMGGMQAKQDRDDAPERAEGKMDDNSYGQVDFKAAAGYKGGAVDEDDYKGGDGEEEGEGEEEWDEDEDYDDDDEEEEERRPATMSAGLMRMLGMEVKEELATDWKPPEHTGLAHSSRLVEERCMLDDNLR